MPLIRLILAIYLSGSICEEWVSDRAACMLMFAANLLVDFSFHSLSQMSNLMNQARLKVLKARDDMIMVRDLLTQMYIFHSCYKLTQVFCF